MNIELSEYIVKSIDELFEEKIEVELSRPEAKFGDYSTNVALQLAGQLKKPPRLIAEQLAGEITKHKSVYEVEVAGPGFINIRLHDEALWESVLTAPVGSLKGQTVVVEYSDPNPFKVLHAGHLYTSVMGDAIANLLENAGVKTHRVNFGGDVGLHVAKTLWSIIKVFDGEWPEKLVEIDKSKRADWLAQRYVEGTKAYEIDEVAKQQIIVLNKKIYQLHEQKDRSSNLAQIYWTTRTWSYDYFDAFYARIGSHFEKYYPESDTVEVGLKTVRKHIGDIFEESNGAVVFNAEKYGLHTRVFINSEGLPTYEAKDVGLSMLKKQDYDFDRSIIITANEQEQYMAVVLKAIEQFAPDLAKATTHLVHGVVKLAGGVKMSSRKGNFLRAVDVLDIANQANQKLNNTEDEQVSLGAVKYAFLKHRMGGDIVYDPQESVSLQGNSGPYLQYAHARACSILGKISSQPSKDFIESFDEHERPLVQKFSEYSEVVEKASLELKPHYVCTYLYELAQEFNRFYENAKVIGDAREAVRSSLVLRYADILRNGLKILGIAAPNHM